MNEERSLQYFFFTGGEKDLRIPADALKDKIEIDNEKFKKRFYIEELSKLYKGRFTQENTFLIETDTEMKHLYSPLNNDSFFYSKFFMDSFSVFAVKMMLEADTAERREVAKNHLMWRGDDTVVKGVSNEQIKKHKYAQCNKGAALKSGEELSLNEET